jgi:hypothetical protein
MMLLRGCTGKRDRERQQRGDENPTARARFHVALLRTLAFLLYRLFFTVA